MIYCEKISGPGFTGSPFLSAAAGMDGYNELLFFFEFFVKPRVASLLFKFFI
jgi:hypothetical protein